ncbi:MAG: sigma-70 family RNA polymerase sigma factor [Gammaproteobacteria bacterium]|nr:sigma-70 family RNA polymerase sigma factor [Gammaproteobacteria bacterium]
MTPPESDLNNLLVKIALGNRPAFAQLYSHTSAKLFAVLLRLLDNRADAEDALQEVFIRIWQRADRYKPSGHSAMPWLHTVARNHAIERLRTKKRQPVPLDEPDSKPSAEATPERSLTASNDLQRVGECLEELEEDRASALCSAYLDGDSYQTLADRFDVPLNTMRTWLRRSLQKLKACFER